MDREVSQLLESVKLDKRGALRPGEWLRVGPKVVREIVSKEIIPEEKANAPISLHEMLTEFGVPKEGHQRLIAEKVVSQVLHRCENAEASDHENWLVLQQGEGDKKQGRPPMRWALKEGWDKSVVVEYLDRWDKENEKKSHEETAKKEEKKIAKGERTPRYKGVLCGPMMKANLRKLGVTVEEFVAEHAEDCEGDWTNVRL